MTSCHAAVVCASATFRTATGNCSGLACRHQCLSAWARKVPEGGLVHGKSVLCDLKVSVMGVTERGSFRSLVQLAWWMGSRSFTPTSGRKVQKLAAPTGRWPWAVASGEAGIAKEKRKVVTSIYHSLTGIHSRE